MSEQKPEEFTLAQELRELGRQIQEAIRVAREHPQTKEFEHQVAQAVNELGRQIDHAVKQAQEDDHLRKATTTASEQFKQTADSFKASGAAEDIERGLAKGLRALNEQISRAIADAETKSKQGPKSG